MILRSATSRQLLAATGVSLLALTAATPALAQTSDDTGASTVETIIVTTTRREENVQDIANSVTAASGEDLAPYTEGGADILTLAARVPSLYAESSNGRVAPR